MPEQTPRQQVLAWLEQQRESVIEWQRGMTAIPAMAPEIGGTGETEKADYLEKILRAIGSDELFRVDAPDDRVPGGLRPNIVARICGKSPRTLWIMGHMDVVPPGDLALWKTSPWTLSVQGDTLAGRGVEDNQQAIVSMLLLAASLKQTDCVPDLGLGLLLVADEECGNRYGMDFVMKARPDLFGPDDFVVVPDMGVADGSLVEVGEKGALWLKVTVTGQQCHASRPGDGKNALLAASAMILHVAEAERLFPAEDPLFDSPSTFAPTRHEENVPNINTVPGTDVFYVDCRVMPCYRNADVLTAFERIFKPLAEKYGVTVSIDVVKDQAAAPVTSPESAVVKRLSASIRSVLHVEPRCIGVGGGTVAAVFREHGIDAVAWATLGGTAHQPNEQSLVSRAIGDARVFASMLFDA